MFFNSCGEELIGFETFSDHTCVISDKVEVKVCLSRLVSMRSNLKIRKWVARGT